LNHFIALTLDGSDVGDVGYVDPFITGGIPAVCSRSMTLIEPRADHDARADDDVARHDGRSRYDAVPPCISFYPVRNHHRRFTRGGVRRPDADRHVP
jgi:hypothetical protein